MKSHVLRILNISSDFVIVAKSRTTLQSLFPKYNSRIDVSRVEKVFYSVITQLGKKIIYQKLDEGRNSRDIKKALELLIDARVILKCIHSNANTIPLMGEMDETIFKIYFLRKLQIQL